MTELSYFKDPNRMEFQAEVTRIQYLQNGIIAATLPLTYFAPTGGGQDHDVGWIGEARVIDVIKLDDGEVYHFLDREVPVGIHNARIDSDRRIRNMQSHTAQHILSRVFELDNDFNTLSSSINFDHPSTIDLDTVSISSSGLRNAEDKANKIVQQNLPVKSYLINDEEISTIPFRRPPKVTGKIRVVEIDGFDYSACGGTHCERTGTVGLIKIVKSEIQNKKLRIHFLAGLLALEFIQEMYEKMNAVSGFLETGWEQVEIAVKKQMDGIHGLRQKMEDYRIKFLELEKNQLRTNQITYKSIKIITNLYNDLDQSDLKQLVNSMRIENCTLAVLASISDSKLTMVVGCSDDIGLDARLIMDSHLKKINGAGGGDKYLAQGGGNYIPGTMQDLAQDTVNIIKQIKFSR
ncbi:MAG TPA: DHHA1 domain-containing protein [Anaerolineales bacterium]|nr:DHHA1 domain-containing protein [Anaerolineales bacterium]